MIVHTPAFKELEKQVDRTNKIYLALKAAFDKTDCNEVIILPIVYGSPNFYKP